MKYERYKEKTDQIAEKNSEISEKISEILEKSAVVEDMLTSEYDDDIAAAIASVEQSLDEAHDAAQEENEELNRQKEDLRSDIQEAIQINQQALNKIHALSNSPYGDIFEESEQVIQERIQQLQSLLDNLDNLAENSRLGSSDGVGTMSHSLADGCYDDNIFLGNTRISEITADTKLENLSKEDFCTIASQYPVIACRLMTDYNNRVVMADNLQAMSRSIALDNGGKLLVLDPSLVQDKATIYDRQSQKYYNVYPNPQGRISHMQGQQGQNQLGMHQDCGIASTAKAINDLYGKKVINENRLVSLAVKTHNCEMVRGRDGTINYAMSGGTFESNVKNLFEANSIQADAYSGSNTPALATIADSLRRGDVAVVAVNHNLMWYYDDAQSFDPQSIDKWRYNNDQRYKVKVDAFIKMKKGQGTFSADHFVNVSNAVYNSNGTLTHFIVSDTGNGTTKMISATHLQRAYQGAGGISVSSQGCVIGRRRP